MRNNQRFILTETVTLRVSVKSSSNYRWLSSGDKIYKSHDEYFEKELSNVLSVNDVLPYREALSTSSPVINVSNGLKKGSVC